MSRTRATKRIGRRFTLELVEPRQLLSVVPAPLPPTAIIAPFNVAILQDGIINLVGAPILSGNPTGTSDGNAKLGPIFLGNSSPSLVVSNQYGATAGTILGGAPIPGFAEVRIETDGIFGSSSNGMPWQGAQPPTLSPIQFIETITPTSTPKDERAPAPATMPEQFSAPAPFIAPESEEFDEPIAAPIFGSPTLGRVAPVAAFLTVATTVSPIEVDAPSDQPGEQWLPVSFDPVDRQYSDAAPTDDQGEQSLAAREPRSQSPLEPSRVNSQTFCDVAYAQSPMPSGDVQAPATAARVDQEFGAGQAQPRIQPRDREVFEPVSAVDLPALHDAAIVDWPTSKLPNVDDALPIARGGLPITVRQEIIVDDRLSAADDESDPLNLIAVSLCENKQFVGALLAAIALNFVWSYNRAPSEDAPAPLAKLNPRKQAERLRAAGG